MLTPQGQTPYVVGLMFNPARTTVLLIRKARPAWQAGYLNGIGGKIEEGESPLIAMEREFLEETGVVARDWQHVVTLQGKTFKLWVFSMFSPLIDSARTMDEPIFRLTISLLAIHNVLPNLRVFIPLALDETGIELPVCMKDGSPLGVSRQTEMLRARQSGTRA